MIMEKIVSEILNDINIVNLYEETDERSNLSSSHGIRHIKNVLELAERIEDVFALPERERLLINTSLALHDIGQIDGRKDHGKRSREFAEKYLPSKNVFSKKELAVIYSAIENHDECYNFHNLKSEVAWFVNLIDKLDFSKNRLADNYREKYSYSVYEEVDHLDFALNGNKFEIKINKVENSNAKIEDLFERVLFSKAVLVFEKFCKKYNLEPTMKFDDKKVDLGLLDKEREMPE